MTVDHAPVDHGATCDTCGLSQHGAQRFTANGFNPRPCPKCPPELQRLPPWKGYTP